MDNNIKDDWQEIKSDAGADDWQDTSGFSPVSMDNIPTQANMSAPQSVMEGFKHGGSLGFSDNIGGAIDAALSKTGNLFVPEGGQNPYENQPVEQVYEAGRDDERAKIDAARKSNPKAFLGGELLGGAGTGMGTSGVKAAAALGAAAGVGGSDAQSPSEAILPALGGAAVGGAGAKIGDLVSAAITKARTATPFVSGAKGVASVTTGLPSEAMPEILDKAARPDDWFFKVQGSKPKSYASEILPEVPGKPIGQALKDEMGSFSIMDYLTHGGTKALKTANSIRQSAPMQQAAQKGLEVAAPALKAADRVVQNGAEMITDNFDKLSPGYQSVLKQAAEKGNRQLAITHFILNSKDPNYQESLKDK